MAGIRLSNSENDTVLRALSLYMWYLSLPESDRPPFRLYLPNEDDEKATARSMYDRAYWLKRKQAGY